MAPAANTAAPDNRRCSIDRWRIPRSPHQCDEVVTYVVKSWIAPISAPPADGPTV